MTEEENSVENFLLRNIVEAIASQGAWEKTCLLADRQQKSFKLLEVYDMLEGVQFDCFSFFRTVNYTSCFLLPLSRGDVAKVSVLRADD